MTIVSFRTAAVALFCRRLTRFGDALGRGGRPAFFERGEVRPVFLRVAT
jgi:hypothetical protein